MNGQAMVVNSVASRAKRFHSLLCLRSHHCGCWWATRSLSSTVKSRRVTSDTAGCCSYVLLVGQLPFLSRDAAWWCFWRQTNQITSRAILASHNALYALLDWSSTSAHNSTGISTLGLLKGHADSITSAGNSPPLADTYPRQPMLCKQPRWLALGLH